MTTKHNCHRRLISRVPKPSGGCEPKKCEDVLFDIDHLSILWFKGYNTVSKNKLLASLANVTSGLVGTYDHVEVVVRMDSGLKVFDSKAGNNTPLLELSERYLRDCVNCSSSVWCSVLESCNAATFQYSSFEKEYVNTHLNKPYNFSSAVIQSRLKSMMQSKGEYTSPKQKSNQQSGNHIIDAPKYIFCSKVACILLQPVLKTATDLDTVSKIKIKNFLNTVLSPDDFQAYCNNTMNYETRRQYESGAQFALDINRLSYTECKSQCNSMTPDDLFSAIQSTGCYKQSFQIIS